MAESEMLAGLLNGLTPVSAFITGLLGGSMVFLISVAAGSLRQRGGGKSESLHIELGGVHQAREWESAEKNSRFEDQGAKDGGRQKLLVRQWRMDEAVVDESLGIS